MAVTPQAYSSGASLITSQLDVYRRRIRHERRLRYLAFAFVGVCAAWTVFVLLLYLDGLPATGGHGYPPLLVCLFLTVALPLASLVFEAVRRPSDAETARLLDSLLDNQQRLLTSVELLSERESSVMAQAQIGSTASILARVNPKTLYPIRAPWQAVSLSLGLLLFALATVLLKSGGPSFVAIQPGQLPPDQSVVGAVQSPTPASGLPESELTPTADAASAPASLMPTAESTPADGQGNTGSADAASQAANSQQAQSDLDRLGKALDGQSATQGAADSLRQGKYDDAAKQLSELGEQNDQLSPAAKQDLADALDQASNDTQSEGALKDAEKNAANALRKGDYKQIDQALKDLGSAVQQTAGNVVPQQQLAKGFPENSDQSSSQGSQGGQQQQGQGGQEGQGQNGQQSQGGNGEQGQGGQQGTNGAGGQQGQGLQGDQGQQGDSAGGGDQSGQEGQGTAPGEGHRVSGPVDPSRPDVKSNPFELDGKGNPNDTRPVDKSDNPALTLEGTASSGAPSSPGSGNTLNTPGESNNLPVDRWTVIQRYFGHDRK